MSYGDPRKHQTLLYGGVASLCRCLSWRGGKYGNVHGVIFTSTQNDSSLGELLPPRFESLPFLNDSREDKVIQLVTEESKSLS